MNGSQSSDFLSESTDIFLNSPPDPVIMDTITYDSLVSSTKTTFSTILTEINSFSFSVYFSTLLKDCSTCITQALDLIVELLSDGDLHTNKLTGYMEDVVSLLHLLSGLVKNIVETVAMTCSSMEIFPSAAGRIIMLVFSHCKDSEALYGCQLIRVEKQLKDLFKTCHELQLAYLMVMEKHFIFDLTDIHEQEILVEALDINLRIGEIVQSLDVKTMAEQWKAYTMICEKYSTALNDKNIHRDCTRILCTMIRNNIQTALEENQEDKIIVRSLKVSSFTLKILLRVCSIFRKAVVKDHENIVELLLYIYLHSEAYLETIGVKSSQFVNLFSNNVTSAVNSLLNELLTDEAFFNCLCNYEVDKIGKDDKVLGIIMLVISIIRTILQRSGDQDLKLPNYRIIDVIYKFLPYCHVWFNMGLKIKCEYKSTNNQTHGLCEHLLTNTTALASTMSCEDINGLEKKMMGAILSTDCCSAIFSANLWILLARISPRQFLLTQVISLCKIYQKLEVNLLNSPQNIHLSHTMHRLFGEMVDEDKITIYNMFSIHDDDNTTLWTCLKVNSLPNEVQWSAGEIVMDKFKRQMRNILDGSVGDIEVLINTIKLASTCSHMDDESEELLIKVWMKACPKSSPSESPLSIKEFNGTNLCYGRFIESLAWLTISMENIFQSNNSNLVKVLHIVSSIIQSGCKEFILVLINILCKLANFEVYDSNKRVVDSILMQTYRKLFQDTDWSVKHKIFHTLSKNRSNNLDKIISKVVTEEDLQEIWSNVLRYGKLKRKEDIKMKEQLLFTMDLKYCHKCIENEELRNSGADILQKSLSNNFDLVDIDSLFDTESDTEPASKKAKLNNSNVEEIISRLETDASLLCKIKENVFNTQYKNRVINVCNKLNNIVN